MAKKKGLPLGTFLKRFSSETQCQEYLASLRWQNGYVCSRCSCRHGYRLSNGRYQCAQCRYQASVTAGTVLHKTHMPLTQWFLAFYFVSQDKRGISAVQLAAMLGTTYKPHGPCSGAFAPLWASGMKPINCAVSSNLMMRTLVAQQWVKSGAGAQKKRRFSWRCLWMSRAILTF